MKNTLIALVAIIVVAGGFYLLKYKTADAPVGDVSRAEKGQDVSAQPAGDLTAPQSPESTMPVPGSTAPEMLATVVVSYSANGYSPATVTVKKGQAVMFVNNEDTETWPASAIHPTHGVYPEKTGADCLGSAFDSCRGLKKGESWEFTFNHVGTWRYHDHLHARHTGSVVVEE